MLPAVFALAERVDPTSYRRYALPNVQVEPLDKGRIDRPPASSQGLLDRLTHPEHHPMLDIDQAPAPVGLDDLGITQSGQWHPPRLGSWTLGPLARRLMPKAAMGQDRHRIIAI